MLNKLLNKILKYFANMKLREMKHLFIFKKRLNTYFYNNSIFTLKMPKRKRCVLSKITYKAKRERIRRRSILTEEDTDEHENNTDEHDNNTDKDENVNI